MSSAGLAGFPAMIAEGACPSLSLSQFLETGKKTDCQCTPLFFSFQGSENIQNDTKLAGKLVSFCKKWPFFRAFVVGRGGPVPFRVPPVKRCLAPPIRQSKEPRGLSPRHV